MKDEFNPDDYQNLRGMSVKTAYRLQAWCYGLAILFLVIGFWKHVGVLIALGIPLLFAAPVLDKMRGVGMNPWDDDDLGHRQRKQDLETMKQDWKRGWR